MSSNSALIIGIDGFIGTGLKKYIRVKYPLWKIYGIDKRVKPSRSNFRLNLNNRSELQQLLLRLNPDYIFHLCGNTASNNFKTMLAGNVHTTFNLLDAVKTLKNYNPRIIIPSSAAEYGATAISKPLAESGLCRPLSYYGLSKLLQTRLSLMFAEQGLNIVIARMFNIAGCATPRNFSIGRFAYELAMIRKGRKKPALHTKNLDTRRDFIDINDACGYLALLAIYGKRGETYNICRGESYKIRHLLDKLIKISGIEKIKIIEDKKHGTKPDAGNSVGLNKKLKRLLKGLEFISIDQTLRDTYSYYLSKV